MGKGEQGQSIRPAGKVAGRRPRRAGSHRKVRRLRQRAAGLSIDAKRRSDPRAAPTLRSRAAGHRKEYSAMTNYALVHGAWHCSWCWARVRHLLAARAHGVFPPTLTGVGERSHLLSRDVGLDTHVADVANLMLGEPTRRRPGRTFLRRYRRRPMRAARA